MESIKTPNNRVVLGIVRVVYFCYVKKRIDEILTQK